MLRECREHGYFRGDECQICGEEGKFLASEQELDNLGRLMAGVLRHFPERFGLTMDDHGWIDMREFTQAVQAAAEESVPCPACGEPLRLEVRESNESARRLYETLGFEEVGVQRGYYTNTNETAVVMEKVLGAL